MLKGGLFDCVIEIPISILRITIKHIYAGTKDGEYYADVESQCQMFHVCSHLANGLAQRFSFLCPNGKVVFLKDHIP